MRFALIGGTRRGCRLLERLLREGRIPCGVVVLEQDRHEIDRCEDEMLALCGAHGIPARRTRRMDQPEWKALFSEEWKPETVFVVGCRILLPLDLFDGTRLGALAVHDSLLPRLRGFAPTNWAMINGERRAGVSLFLLSERMDEGRVVLQSSFELDEAEGISDVHRRVCEATEDVILRFLENPDGMVESAKEQDVDAATYGCSRNPRDGLIDWGRPAPDIVRLVGALEHPWPGAFTHNGARRVRVWKAIVSPDRRVWSGRIPGRVVGYDDVEGWVDVLAGEGSVRVLLAEIEGDGGGIRPASALFRSPRITFGLGETEMFDRLKSLDDRIVALERGGEQ